MNLASNHTVLEQVQSDLRHTIFPVSSHLFRFTVDVPAFIVQTIVNQVVDFFQHNIKPKGLETHILPPSFITEHYRKEVYDCTKRFILKHLVLDYINTQLPLQKIIIANYPRLAAMDLTPEGSLRYIFEVSSIEAIKLKDWKLFSFKAPKRKLYKDLDKQVESFIEREHSMYRELSHDTVADNDWVCFEATLLSKTHEPIAHTGHSRFWMKMNTKYLTSPFQHAFVGRKIDDTFMVNTFPINDFFHEPMSEKSSFQIKIISITKGQFFSLESFKTMFKLKNKNEVHRKLIEVFSYRNDISQRKSIVEELFHLLLSKHRFEIPKHLILRKQEEILLSLRKLPDYHVYKAQKSFLRQVELLAEKQLKEETLIDQIGYDENVKLNEGEIPNYLNLFNNERLKEFVYFKPVQEPLEDTDSPFHETVLRHCATREKTLNHIIHVLTR